MASSDPVPTPSGHTPEGGVLVGKTSARQGMVLFEDPQCPYCRQFEEINGALITAASGPVTSPSNIACGASSAKSRCGPTTRSSSPQRPVVLTSSATRSLPHSPPREPGVSRPRSFCVWAHGAGLTDAGFVSGVQSARYEKWVLRRETVFQAQDPQGTPAAWLNGHPIGSNVLFDRLAFESELRPLDATPRCVKHVSLGVKPDQSVRTVSR